MCRWSHRETVAGVVERVSNFDLAVRLYHAHAPLIMKRSLEAMELILGEMLDGQSPDCAEIAPIRK